MKIKELDGLKGKYEEAYNSIKMQPNSMTTSSKISSTTRSTGVSFDDKNLS